MVYPRLAIEAMSRVGPNGRAVIPRAWIGPCQEVVTLKKLSIPLSLALIVLGALLMPTCVSPHTVPFDADKQHSQKVAAGCPLSVQDRDGNSYGTVLIGRQCWFAQNLRVSHYRDGSAIETEHVAVIDLEKYGRLYRWAAVTNPAGLCPEGWHVPSDAEFQQLELAVGMAPETVRETGWRNTAGESRKLKQTDVARQWTPKTRAQVNQSGFSALPGGGSSGWVTGADGLYGDFWTRTEHDEDRAWHRSLTWWSMHPSRESIRRVHIDKGTGTSVRCILDAPSGPVTAAP